MTNTKRRFFFLGIAFILALMFCIPWVIDNFLNIEQDLLFHLTRIHYLSDAISHGDFFPRVYPDENFGFGYAEPLFYCHFLLIPFAVLHNAGLPLSITYELIVFTFVVLGNYAMLCLCYRISRRLIPSITATAGFCFSNYHVTDVFVRCALGESMAIAFIPIVIFGMYSLLYEKNKFGWIYVWLGFMGLIMSHNLTFLIVGIVYLICFLVCMVRNNENSVFLCGSLKAAVMVFICSAWFTLPMVEQMMSQRFTVSSLIKSKTILGRFAVLPEQYLRNSTTFGTAQHDVPVEEQMVLNIGFFLTLMPILAFFVKNKSKDKLWVSFVRPCTIIGYVCLFFPISLIPWDKIVPLRMIQFPWRLFVVSMSVLTISSLYAMTNAIPEKFSKCVIVLLIFVCAEGIAHTLPVLKQGFGISLKTTYDDILNTYLPKAYADETRCDFAFQVSGAEYVPELSACFRTLKPAIWNSDGSETNVNYRRDYTSLFFEADDSFVNTWKVMPLSWYKGYSAYNRTKNEKIQVESNADKLVSVFCTDAGSYEVVYDGTIVQKISGLLSVCGTIVMMVIIISKQYQKI